MEHLKHHIKHMAIAAAAVLLILAVAGVDFGAALRYAAVLACPLGMIGMIFLMGRQHGKASNDQPSTDQSAPSDSDGSIDQRRAHHH